MFMVAFSQEADSCFRLKILLFAGPFSVAMDSLSPFACFFKQMTEPTKKSERNKEFVSIIIGWFEANTF